MSGHAPEFVPGITLCEQFFHETVRPVLEAEFAGLKYSAALIGPGSEVLGFDTAMSTDHHWGPRAMLFLREEDFGLLHDQIVEALRHKLPHRFRGFPTNFTLPDPNDNGVQILQEALGGTINHRVEVFTISRFCREYLDLAPDASPDAADWLTVPQQKLRSITSGAVYHDDLGLRDVRARFAWYPRDVWLYLLASQWSRIDQEQPFVGRAGSVGDELGSRVIAARLVQQAIRLCFLMEQQFAPYSKWLGTAFSKLRCAEMLKPKFDRVLSAEEWQTRAGALCEGMETIASMHNALNITTPLPTNASPFFGRPFKVIHAGAFAEAITAQIQDESVKNIPTKIGGIDVFSDSTDLLEATQLRRKLKSLFSQGDVRQT